jgi:hypothetical protein
MPTVFIRKSNRVNKKWVAILPLDKYPELFKVKTVHFGDSRFEDYTQHGDELRKSRYISRHIKNENWRDFNTSGFWSMWLLWSRPDINEAVKLIERQTGIKVRFIR